MQGREMTGDWPIVPPHAQRQAAQNGAMPVVPQTATLPAGSTPMINRLTDSLEFQSQALRLRADRQRIIAGNIANADTPQFQARDFNFASALRDATGHSDGGRSASSMKAAMKVGMNSGTQREPELLYAVPNQTNVDGNTVNMDRERQAFLENAVKYEATLRFINGSVRTMLDAMKSPGQG